MGGHILKEHDIKQENSKTLKIVRVLTHTLPKIKMQAFDVLTGRNVTLSEGAEWDDDGEAVEDEVSDEESGISDRFSATMDSNYKWQKRRDHLSTFLY